MRYRLLFVIAILTTTISCNLDEDKTEEKEIVSDIQKSPNNDLAGICQDAESCLSKYSYPIFLKESGKSKIANGTGFFYRKDNKTFLVSNYHVLVGWDPTAEMMKEYDSLYVLKDQTLFLATIAGRNIVKKISKLPFDKMLDIHAVQIDATGLSSMINYINPLLDSIFPSKKADKIIFYGFPSDSQAYSGTVMEAKKVKYTGKQVFGYDLWINQLVLTNPKFTRSQLDSAIKLKFADKYYFVSPSIKQGNSGAAVFGEFKEKDKVVYRFMGVYFASKFETNTSWIIRPDKVHKYLKTL